MTTTPEERERQAKREAGETLFSPGVQSFLCIYMVVVIVIGISSQLIRDLRDDPSTWPRTLDPTQLIPVGEEIRAAATVDSWVVAFKLANDRLRTNIRDYESNLEDSSPLIESLIPSVNLLVTGMLNGSTESVYPGLGGWFFYRPDVDYVTGRGFLETAAMEGRRDVEPDIEPDPLPAILELKDALSARDIELLIVPVPVKPTIYPDKYTRRFDDSKTWIQNPSYAEFLKRLNKGTIAYVDLTAVLWQARNELTQPLYMQTDTHWTPSGIQVAASEIAKAVRTLVQDWQRPIEGYSYTQVQVSNQGDTLAMLRLTRHRAEAMTEVVTVNEVALEDGQAWSVDANAEILFLGDSFANIYSLASQGWGSGAGLVEHVSALMGRPIDTIRMNNNGSFATRLALAGQLRRGRNTLAGKKIVIYQFACRELAFGDWKTGLGY